MLRDHLKVAPLTLSWPTLHAVLAPPYTQSSSNTSYNFGIQVWESSLLDIKKHSPVRGNFQLFPAVAPFVSLRAFVTFKDRIVGKISR